MATYSTQYALADRLAVIPQEDLANSLLRSLALALPDDSYTVLDTELEEGEEPPAGVYGLSRTLIAHQWDSNLYCYRLETAEGPGLLLKWDDGPSAPSGPSLFVVPSKLIGWMAAE